MEKLYLGGYEATGSRVQDIGLKVFRVLGSACLGSMEGGRTWQDFDALVLSAWAYRVSLQTFQRGCVFSMWRLTLNGLGCRGLRLRSNPKPSTLNLRTRETNHWLWNAHGDTSPSIGYTISRTDSLSRPLWIPTYIKTRSPYTSYSILKP